MLSTEKASKWLELCEAGAKIFSTCGKRQYYSIVLSSSGRVVGSGYNGSPPGVKHCVDGGCPRLAENSPSGSSYSNCVANHAEQNAIMWSDRFAREGGTLIVNGTPCWECTKLICGSGVKTLVYKYDPAYASWDKCEELLLSVGITCVAIASIDNNPVPGCSVGCGQPVALDVARWDRESDPMGRSVRLRPALGNDPSYADNDPYYA